MAIVRSRALQPIWVFSTLSALLAAGYGVLFTIVGDYRDEYGISETTVGWIIGIGFIVAFASQIAIGPLGDGGHARTLVFGGAIVNVFGLLLMGFGTTAPVILSGRIVSGLAIGAASPAIKRIVVVGSGENLGRNLGRLFSADVFGFAMGPVISAVLVGPFGLAAPFLVIAALTMVVVGVTLSLEVQEAPDTDSRRFAIDLLRLRPFAGAVMIGAAAFMMIGAFDALWDLVHTDLGTTEWVANLGIALFAVPLVILGPTSGRLAQRIGPFLVASAGLAAGALFMAIYGALTVGLAIFAVAMVHALTDGLSFAASGVAVGMAAPEHRQAGAQGVLGGMQALAAGVMAPFAGWLYENHGQQVAYWFAAIIMIAMVAGGLLLAGSDARHLKGRRIQGPGAAAGGWGSRTADRTVCAATGDHLE
ncbi:MAG: MFS transporter [Acidimicrobiia bacterium]|nr:MFS transporter [Acidimicrobiia bacterium]